ncbi:hypothetical protein PACTADRAFT_73730 [Pachysolen tannophilus NRRL Y-2460]|uniref:Uncharacterized protein n=1 Tax=Pachysolen tannophilus NRRL Y-2460 TaxID=669874 RepID=A0A1E4U287_PACTA|nr:hypothetical protein PACTADRAFT_73730 [Pachysolen tannophilus NRRL Y-2460]
MALNQQHQNKNCSQPCLNDLSSNVVSSLDASARSQINNNNNNNNNRNDNVTGFDSNLDDSHWILFSPSNSSEVANIDSEGDGDDDVLSSLSCKTIDDKGENGNNNKRHRSTSSPGSDSEDSLIESLNENHSKSSIYNGNDLTTRIDNWRKEAIGSVISGSNNSGDDNASVGGNKDQAENSEFMKSWGIDNSSIKSGNTNNNNNNNKSFKKIKNSKSDKLFYGSEILSQYDKKQLKIIGQIIVKLSKELYVENGKNDKISSLKQMEFTNYHSTYLQHLQEANQKKFSNNNKIPPDTNNIKQRHSVGGKFLNNPDLEKYLPLFIKNLILNNKNNVRAKFFDKNELLDEEKERNQSSHFWNNDLKSCNSSLLTMSTNSLILNFGLNA